MVLAPWKIRDVTAPHTSDHPSGGRHLPYLPSRGSHSGWTPHTPGVTAPPPIARPPPLAVTVRPGPASDTRRLCHAARGAAGACEQPLARPVSRLRCRPLCSCQTRGSAWPGPCRTERSQRGGPSVTCRTERSQRGGPSVTCRTERGYICHLLDRAESARGPSVTCRTAMSKGGDVSSTSWQVCRYIDVVIDGPCPAMTDIGHV